MCICMRCLLVLLCMAPSLVRCSCSQGGVRVQSCSIFARAGWGEKLARPDGGLFAATLGASKIVTVQALSICWIGDAISVFLGLFSVFRQCWLVLLLGV